MRRFLAGLVIASLASLVACSVQNSEKGSSSGSPAGSSGGSSGTSSANSPSTNGDGDGGTAQSGDGSATNAPAPSTTAAEIDIDGTCSAWVACGGNPQGTYDYTGGCIEDVFSGARGACPALDTSKAKVTVKGSVTFSGNALTRNVTVTTSGTITLPESCTYGQCAAIESELKSTFDSVSCSGSGDCVCTVSKTETEQDATTYTLQGSLLSTADGDEYSICDKGADLSYSGKSTGTEQGTFTLKKR
jgi:hypothetical protein